MDWISFAQFTNDYIGPIESNLSIIEIVFVILIFFKISVGQKRRQRKVTNELRNQQGNRPAILVLDLNPRKNIRNDVERCRQLDPELAKISDNLVKEITWSREITPDDTVEIVKQLRQANSEFALEAVDQINFFFSGPSPVAALVGAEFVNSCPVRLYHYDASRSTYMNWGPIRHDIVA